ncbi:MAG: hypothetical protein JST68_27290 [Bacteroidetes bacterium]|nr:hypothetical protein [Bacteroidota bacterium]
MEQTPQQEPEKKDYTPLIVLAGILFCVWLVIYVKETLKQRKMDADPTYVIGRVAEVEKSKSSRIYRYSFNYHGGTYSSKFSGIGLPFRVKSFVFVQILKTDPAVCTAVRDVTVPICLTQDDVPKDGWTELPVAACDTSRTIAHIIQLNHRFYWNIRDSGAAYVKGSYLFSADGKCRFFNYNKGVRTAYAMDDLAWEALNDSTFQIEGIDRRILFFSEDSIVLQNRMTGNIFFLLKSDEKK